MRMALFILGLIASATTATGGVAFLRFDAVAGWLLENLLRPDALDASKTVSVTGISYGNVGIVLLLAGVCGGIGAVQFVLGHGIHGSILLFVPALAVAAVCPFALACSGLQAVVAVLMFFMAPSSRMTPAVVQSAA